MINVTNDRGRRFRVRVDGDTVHISDLTYSGEKARTAEWVAHGQPVTSYYVSTLLGTDEYSDPPNPSAGLNLHGGVDVWYLDAPAYREVVAYLRGWVARDAGPPKYPGACARCGLDETLGHDPGCDLDPNPGNR